MKKLATKLIIAAVVLSVTTIRGGQAQEAISKMRSSWDAVQCYTVRMHINQVKDSRTKDYTVDFSYNSSGWIKTHIIDGDNKGSVVVYDPVNHRIRVRWAGVALPVNLSPDSKMTQGLRGEKIYEGSFGAMLKDADWYLSHGSLSWIGEEPFEGADCAVIEFVTTLPDENRGIARERWWLDKSTSLPRKIEGYESDGKEVERVIYRNLKLNPDLPEDHFKL
ncbi:MAG: outer membrane lipoprotein carrier protein LolA [Candidatus Stahlbacteria bacterium]|nr:MAG: outer membrane lipoprotein carrier protein LolA [Candidatus Stahlbacteria bacterium]